MPISPGPRSDGILDLYRVFWRYAAGLRGLAATFLAMLVLAQVVRLSIPYFFGEAINAIQNTVQDIGGASRYMTLMFGACIVAWMLHGPGRIIERFVAVRIRERFADALYTKATNLPLRWHEAHHSGDTIQRMNKATGALFSFSQHQFIYLQNLVSLVGPVAALFVISFATGAVALFGYALIFMVLVRFDAVMLHLAHEENRADRRYNAELVDCLGNISTVQTLRLQAATRRVIAMRLNAVFEPMRRNIVVNEGKWCAIDLINNGLRTGLVVLYAWLSWREGGIILLGTAVMVHQYSQQAGTVVSAMATHWQDLVQYQADISSAGEILGAESRPQADGRIATDWREIRVEGVEFRYIRDRDKVPALKDVSITLRRGGRTALVGESGSGKSTLLRVLAGLYQADRAVFRIDGEPVSGLHDLGATATLIPQDPEVFEATISQNITMGIDYPEPLIQHACRLACLGPVIERLPLGLETEVSERGLNLSGGQKQRLALARGILASSDSSLIMLDEPTSCLDPATEAQFYDNLLAEFPKACIVSSIHRLHLLPRFDVIVLLADGQVMDMGSLGELLDRQPSFREVWERYAGTGVPILAA